MNTLAKPQFRDLSQGECAGGEETYGFHTIRFVTHKDVGEPDVAKLVDTLKRVMKD